MQIFISFQCVTLLNDSKLTHNIVRFSLGIKNSKKKKWFKKKVREV